MSSSSTSLLSISKHSGALISSRLIPPKVGAMALTVSTKPSTSILSTSMSKTSMSANALNSRPFPSITGLAARGPMSPSPRTAVPLLTTATRLPFEVYLYALSGSLSISLHGNATPGEYARDNSWEVPCGFVGTTVSFPAGFAA